MCSVAVESHSGREMVADFELTQRLAWACSRLNDASRCRGLGCSRLASREWLSAVGPGEG